MRGALDVETRWRRPAPWGWSAVFLECNSVILMFSGIIVISVIAAFKRGVKIRRCVGTDRHGGFARRRRRHPSCGGLRPAPNEPVAGGLHAGA